MQLMYYTVYRLQSHAAIECSQKLSASHLYFYLLPKCNLNLWNVLLLNIICDKWKFQIFNQLACLEYITCQVQSRLPLVGGFPYGSNLSLRSRRYSRARENGKLEIPPAQKRHILSSAHRMAPPILMFSYILIICQTHVFTPVQIYGFDVSYIRFIQCYEDKNTTFDSV